MRCEEVVEDGVPYADLAIDELVRSSWLESKDSEWDNEAARSARVRIGSTYMPHKWKILIIRQHDQQTGNATVATWPSEERLKQRLGLECANCERKACTERYAAEGKSCRRCHNENAISSKRKI